MNPAGWLPLDGVMALTAGWIALGLLGLLGAQRAFATRALFLGGSILSVGLAGLALYALNGPAEVAVLALGLPELPAHLRLDALSAFFLFLIGTVSAGVGVFSASYFSAPEHRATGRLILAYHTFIAAMVAVVLSDDAYVFMVGWESMALASYFLVITDDRSEEVRSAAFLYLFIAHVGAIAILLCFGVLAAPTGDYRFSAMRAAHLTPFWASTAFVLATVGFGAKAGLVPLHVWLPEAHPAAPAPVSALMSAVMLKTAIYALLRISFDLIGQSLWWWGVMLLAVGLLTGLLGVVFSTVETDMKRLLAYSSIENIGLVVVGIGLSLLFHSYGMASLAALAALAALYHALGHGFFKSLLFLATGSIQSATGVRRLSELGGLIRVLPWVAFPALIGILAASGLPPLAGFVAEWLLLQSFLFTPQLPAGFLDMLIPVLAAGIVLIASLAGYTMVKFYGIVFLGRPRRPLSADVHDAPFWERVAFVGLSFASVALGLFPGPVLRAFEPCVRLLMGAGLSPDAHAGWLYLVPVSAARASYAPGIFLAVVAAAWLLTFALVRLWFHGRMRRAPPWDCGFPGLTPRMQDSAEGFGQPIRRVFDVLFDSRVEVPGAFDRAPRYRIRIADYSWALLYQPVVRAARATADLCALLQRGRIAIYLLFSFATLVAMLLVVNV